MRRHCAYVRGRQQRRGRRRRVPWGANYRAGGAHGIYGWKFREKDYWVANPPPRNFASAPHYVRLISARAAGGWCGWGMRKRSFTQYRDDGTTLIPSAFSTVTWSPAIPAAARYLMQTKIDEIWPVARADVKAMLTASPWGATFTPRFSVTPTTTQFIMAKGRDYAEKRLVEIANDAVQARAWSLYHKMQAADAIRSRRPPTYDQRQQMKWQEKYGRLIDHAQHLRSVFSATYPPSVPAPSAPATVSGSNDGSPETLELRRSGTRRILTTPPSSPPPPQSPMLED